MMSRQIVDQLFILLLKTIVAQFVVFFLKIIFMQIYSMPIRTPVFLSYSHINNMPSHLLLLLLALHIAVQHGHLDVVRRLLAESDIDLLTVNAKLVVKRSTAFKMTQALVVGEETVCMS